MVKRLTKIAAPAALIMFAGTAQAVNVAVNGSFETGDFTGWTQFPSGPGQQTVNSNMPGDTSSDGIFHAVINNDVALSNSIIKNANIGIGVVAPNSPYTITFDARGSYAVPGGVAFAEFFSELSGGGTSKAEILGGSPLAIDPDPTVWTSFIFTGTTGPDVSGGVTLQLGAANGPGVPTEMFYDNIVVDVTAVPVPAAVWLFGSGLIGLIGIARRRKAA